MKLTVKTKVIETKSTYVTELEIEHLLVDNFCKAAKVRPELVRVEWDEISSGGIRGCSISVIEEKEQ